MRPAPTGIDRVELAYARRWANHPETCTYVAGNAWGGLAAVPHAGIDRLGLALEEAWAAGPMASRALDRARAEALRLHAMLLTGAGRARLHQQARATQNGIYLLVSHQALENPRRIAFLRSLGLAFVPLVHDVIPITHPEYTRPSQVAKHARRIANTAALADGIIVNSAATAAALLDHLPRSGKHGRPLPPISVARLGLVQRPPVPQGGVPQGAPYFVALGSIEPRKNHTLLLNLWRDLAEAMGPAAPRLIIIGRRSFDSESIMAALDRSPPLAALVQEAGAVADSQVTALLTGARALLFPTFAEGFGLPLAEALALGTPAIVSDVAALREVGGAVPEYLNPLDGLGWREAVLHYAQPQSPRRDAQLARLRGWQPPDWHQHFAVVDALLDQLAAGRQPATRRLPWGAPVALPPLAQPPLGASLPLAPGAR